MLVHQHENNPDTQEFLKSNGEKFQGDCLTAMRLMFSGIRLTSQDCWVKYGINDRRLRDCHNARPDTVKKEWKLNEQGKRMYVEYFIEKFQPPTKADLQKWFSDFQEQKGEGKLIQIPLFK